MILSYDSIRVKLGNKQILESVSLSTRPGKLVGIVGANGCGKSTLIKTTFGTVPKQGGTITLDGQPVSHFAPRELASILGYVGAGGLGLIMNEKIGWREYDSLGMILIVLFVTVIVIEALSHWLRKRLT